VLPRRLQKPRRCAESCQPRLHVAGAAALAERLSGDSASESARRTSKGGTCYTSSRKVSTRCSRHLLLQLLGLPIDVPDSWAVRSTIPIMPYIGVRTSGPPRCDARRPDLRFRRQSRSLHLRERRQIACLEPPLIGRKGRSKVKSSTTSRRFSVGVIRKSSATYTISSAIRHAVPVGEACVRRRCRAERTDD